MTDEQKRQEQLIIQLAEICEELNWVVGIPADDSGTMVPGLIIGTEAFLGQVVEVAFKDYEVYSHDAGTDGMVELPVGESNEPLNKKKPTFH